MLNINTILCLVCTAAAIFAIPCYAADQAAETVSSKAQRKCPVTEPANTRIGTQPLWLVKSHDNKETKQKPKNNF